MNQHEEKAREIALWLYGPDEGMSEGLVMTLIDKITEAIASAEKKGREDGMKTFIEFYEELYGHFPGHNGEFVHDIQMRCFNAFAQYVDYSVKEKLGSIDKEPK